MTGAGPGTRGAPRRRLQAGPAPRREGEREGGLGNAQGSAGHQNEADREAWEDDDNKTLEFPFAAKSLGAPDPFRALPLRAGAGGRGEGTPQAGNPSVPRRLLEGWAEILGF